MPPNEHEYHKPQAEQQEHRNYPAVRSFVFRGFHLRPEGLHLEVRLIGEVYKYRGVLVKVVVPGVGYRITAGLLVEHFVRPLCGVE